MKSKFKKLIVRSPLHKLSIDIKARMHLSNFSDVNDEISGNTTVYCISPYKTATTYLSRCYRPEVSAHEPLHYLSLQYLEKEFDDFFIRRLNTLNLKLECSGFLSAYIDELAAHPIAKDLTYITILRSPSSWITSAVNHWDKMGKSGINYDYTTLLFWKKIIGVDLDSLLAVSEAERQKGIEKLAEFYMTFTRKTRLLQNMHYVDIKDIDAFLPFLDRIIEETSNPEQSWKRANRNKVFHYENKELDQEYEELVMEHAAI